MDSPTLPPPPPASDVQATGVAGARAGFWRRFVQYILDAIIFGVVGGALAAALGASAVGRQGLVTVLGVVYFTVLEGSSSQTIGMRVLGLRVVDSKTGGPIDYSRAFIRSLGRILASIPIGLGYLWVAWDKEKQGWHDKIGSTYVIKT